MVIYADVLFSLNAICTLFQILAACALCKQKPRRLRIFLASILGGLCAAVIFFPKMTVLLQILVQLGSASLITFAAFGKKKPWVFIKLALCFIGTGAVFAGFAFAVWYLMEPSAFQISNGVMYFQISPLLLIGSTVVCYMLLTLFARLRARQPNNQPCRLEITKNGRSIRLTAIIDTANALTEPISGAETAVVSASAISSLFDPQALRFLLRPTAGEDRGLLNSIRLVPVKTVTGKDLLAAFLPDSMTVMLPGKAAVPLPGVYIAVCPHDLSDEYDALLHSRTLA